MGPDRDDFQHQPTRRLDSVDDLEPTTAGATDAAERASGEGDGMVGRSIGNIRLEEILGQGGMGTVYRGVDEKLGRAVAVKSIRAGQMLDGQARARFLREAQVLSRLNHPHICQVYDFVEGAEEDYLVLELIKGESLRRAIKEGIPRAQALRIALELADVLTVTHSRGIVHRDLKPDNVMLTDDSRIKVLDFGLARQEIESAARVGSVEPGNRPEAASTLEGSSDVETVFGTVVGTVGYMSPEQARGEAASPPSDIYSLGLLLQEIFTGRTPYDSKSTVQQLLLATSEGLSPRAVGLPADLVQLIEGMKSLDADDRPTAPNVADRLRRIIDKPRRRMRWAVAILAVVVTVGGSTKYVVDLSRERTAALEARSEALAAREDAEELMGFILQDLYAGLQPLGRLDLLGQVAHQALDYYRPEGQRESLTDRGLLRRGIALRNLGGVFEDQGALEEAEAAYRGSLEISKDLLARDPTDQEAVVGLVRAHAGLAALDVMRDDPDGALASYGEAIDHLQGLIAVDSTNREWRRRLADIYTDRGHVLFTAGMSVEALEDLRRAVTITQNLIEETPDHAELELDLGTRYRLLSQMLAAQGDAEQARLASDSDLSICTAVAMADATNTNAQLALVEGYTWRGRLLMDEGELDAAKDAIRSSVRVGERLVADDPTNTHRQFRLSASYDYLGEALLASGQVSASLEAFTHALELMQPIAALDVSNAYFQNDLAYSYLQVGKAQAALGRHNQAQAAWREGARVVAPVAGEAGLPPIQETYAQALLLVGRIDEARPVIRRVLESGWPLDPTTADLCRKHGIEIRE